MPLHTTELRPWMDGDTITICLPGILARAASQFRPLESFLPPGRVVAVDGDNLVATVDLIEEVKVGWSRTLLVGASMGGMRIPFYVEEYRRRHPEGSLSWLENVIIDAPNGAPTMKELPALGRPLVRSSVTGPLIGSAVMQFLRGPKDSEIDVPAPELMVSIAGMAMAADEWRGHVKSTALDNMSGFPGRQWWEWAEWMMRVGVGGDRSLERAAASLIGLKTTYIANTHPGNVTVAQPAAANWWRAFAGARVVEVDAVHCGFLQQPERFREALMAV